MVKPGVQTKIVAGLVLVSTLSLAGCDQLGNPMDVLTGKRQAPDEFLVVARKPLKMPGSLELPEPRLGARSPLEPDPSTAAVIALLGAPAVGAAPAGPNSGEQALLNAANATATNLPQRNAELQAVEQQLEGNQPYEAPLLVDLLTGEEDEEVGEDALIAGSEARRLQVEGVAPTPIDPNDFPVPEQPQSASEPRPELDRRPNNRLPSAPTETAF